MVIRFGKRSHSISNSLTLWIHTRKIFQHTLHKCCIIHHFRVIIFFSLNKQIDKQDCIRNTNHRNKSNLSVKYISKTKEQNVSFNPLITTIPKMEQHALMGWIGNSIDIKEKVIIAKDLNAINWNGLFELGQNNFTSEEVQKFLVWTRQDLKPSFFSHLVIFFSWLKTFQHFYNF